MLAGPITVQSHGPLFVALAVHLAQGLYYYPRLPGEIAYKYEFSREPRLWCSKSGYFVLMGLLVCAIATTPLVAGVVLVWPVSFALMLIAVVDQYLFAANLRGGPLHPSVWFVLIAVLAGGTWLVHLHVPK